MDYMGGSLYPESLIRVHADFLSENILGNTHSVSNRCVNTRLSLYNDGTESFPLTRLVSSKLSLKCADEARAAILLFFKAPPEYTVVFTPNASGALKLVGEAYPFTGGSSFVLPADAHNSVHGIREFAANHDARVAYIPSTHHGGLDMDIAKVCSIYMLVYSRLDAILDLFTTISTASERRSTKSFCNYWPFQHHQLKDTFIDNRICFISWLSYPLGRSRPRSDLPDFPIRDPRRRNGGILLQNVRLPDRSGGIDREKIVSQTTQKTMVCGRDSSGGTGSRKSCHSIS